MSPVALFLLLVLAVCCWPAMRLLAQPTFRQVAPGQWLFLTTAGLLATAAVVTLAVFWPNWLPALTVLMVALVGLSAYRSRVGFGHGRRLPPGSLSPWRSIEALIERDFYARQASQHGPIFKMAQFHRGVICVVGLEHGHRILREQQKNLGPSVQPFNREIDGGFLRYMEDSVHRRYARLFRSALSPAVVGAAREAVSAAASEELEDMALASAQGQSVSPEWYLKRYVSRSFLSVLFGVLPGTESFDRFEQIYPPLGDQPLGSPLSKRALEALDGLRRWVDLEAGLLRTEAGRSTSALGHLVGADEAMPDSTAVDNLLFIHKISSDNVVALLRWLVKMLGDHPEWAERLQAENETDSDLSDRVVLETLRLAQSEYLYREIVDDFEVEGVRFPRNWLLRVCVRESHADQEVFPDADSFDPDRFLEHRFDSSQYSPFGFGPHACNGVHLTMMIAGTWIEKICVGYDWSIVRDGPVEKEFRHWSHWRPSRNLALTLAKRADMESSAVADTPLGSVR